MKIIKLFDDYLEMAAAAQNMSREQYTAYYLSEAKAVSSQNEPFKVKGIGFTYTERQGKFYGAYLYDVAKTSNVQHKVKFGLDEIQSFLKSIKITDEVPSRYEEKELDALCKLIAKKGIVCDYNDAMDIS